MRSLFRGLGGLAAATAIILFGSCDKHDLGEYPEVQKEHADPAVEANPASEKAEPAKAAGAESSATPAEFFPEKSPSKSP